MRKWSALAMGVVFVTSVAACNGNAAAPEPDRVATDVAVARAVAATLTASAPAAVPPAVTLVPPTAAATVEAQPTATAPRPPTATPTLVPEAADPFVPGVGTPKGLVGKIVLPGYSGPLDPPVFHDSIVFKLEVFDPAFGNVDGAGIKAVNIEAVDPLGRIVIERREGSWAYCAFANAQNDPNCDVWRFSEHNFTWPNGTPVCAGSGYSVNMVVETENPANDGANWRFEFAIESPDGNLPNCF